jgi:predicted methyltransferase
MTETFLVKYLSNDGVEQYKLVETEAFSADGEPTFEVEGVSIFSILSIQPYL